MRVSHDVLVLVMSSWFRSIRAYLFKMKGLLLISVCLLATVKADEGKFFFSFAK